MASQNSGEGTLALTVANGTTRIYGSSRPCVAWTPTAGTKSVSAMPRAITSCGHGSGRLGRAGTSSTRRAYQVRNKTMAAVRT